MVSRSGKHTRAFTLVEVVIVVLIIGMIASMAIPRISRASEGASDTALAGDIVIVRKALLLYAAEHENDFPGPTADEVVQQLTQYSDRFGDTAGVRTSAYPYGPYLALIPECPIGHNPGSREVAIDMHSPPMQRVGTTAGWVYNPDTGEFLPNATTDDIRAHLADNLEYAGIVGSLLSDEDEDETESEVAGEAPAGGLIQFGRDLMSQ